VRTAARNAVRLLLAVGIVAAACLLSTAIAAAAPGPGWSIRSLAQPTNFSGLPDAVCEVNTGSELCDSYTLIVTNVGSQATETPVTIADILPTGIRAVHVVGEDLATGEGLTCDKTLVRCVDSLDVVPGDRLLMTINVVVDESSISHPTINTAEVFGGGAPPVSVTESTKISTEPALFGIQDFGFQALDAGGMIDTQAGGHPYALTTSLDFTTLEAELNGGSYGPGEEVRDVVVNLPSGFIGNPQATPTRCPQHDLLLQVGKTACPASSRIGTLLFEASPGSFRASENSESETTAVYNMEPEAGYPAEFGFSYLGKPIFLYASLVRQGSGYGLRVASPGIPSLETIGVSLLLFGNPAQRDGLASGVPFFTNPVDCTGGSSEARLEADTWGNPGVFFSKTSNAYPHVTGCSMLQFHPTLTVRPETTQADEPSGYSFDIKNPQYEGESALGTPELKNVTVALPPGVSISPSAADGLGTCPAEGPNGINVGSSNVTPQGQDIGDPDATELGNGQGGAGESPYDDGLYHIAPGHCPSNSTVASVEVESPLLTKPLLGHLYVAQPGCGGGGQALCTAADASDGNLVGVYLEAAGSGVIVKLRGSVSIDPTTGQLSVKFRENPQLPFGDLRVQVDGGPRAPLANPLTCGPATGSADLTPWSAPITPDATPLSSFTIDWDGQGGPCPATPPLTPGFSAGMTTSLSAGTFSPFTLTLSRGDRQQYLSQLSVTTPPGLLGMLSSVTLCGEPQAAEGTCSAASEIGTTTVAAGAGSHPYWVTGHVYLTTGYEGAPFGLTIVVPAKAGPFNLGSVVVRASINVNPETSALTIVSDPLPQIIDGVPLRVQTINVAVNRPGFMFNPTNCEAHQITATVAGAQGGGAQVSTPFTAAGCRNLSFSPTFTVSTAAKTSKKGGASLDVKVAYKPGQANIRSVSVVLPKQLPARLTTIQQACPEATFAANPATCPPGSLIGVVKARTPVLPVQLIGPAYLVSHGGAAFPDVVVIVQGDGVRVDLTGSIDIKKSITSSTFAKVPDVPITSFDLNLPEGPHSALTTALPSKARGDLCGQKLTMPTTLTGQNGLQVKQSTKITVSGCPKPKPKPKQKTKKSRK
jgi:hypothetical protein